VRLAAINILHYANRSKLQLQNMQIAIDFSHFWPNIGQNSVPRADSASGVHTLIF
jgi:hypothetical protein